MWLVNAGLIQAVCVRVPQAQVVELCMCPHHVLMPFCAQSRPTGPNMQRAKRWWRSRLLAIHVLRPVLAVLLLLLWPGAIHSLHCLYVYSAQAVTSIVRICTVTVLHVCEL